jgi:alpha-amylase
MGVLLEGFFDVRSASATLVGSPRRSGARSGKSGRSPRSGSPPPLKGAPGGLSNGYDPFDDYDLGSKDQKGTVPTHYGAREQLERCAAMMRNFVYKDAFGNNKGGRFPKGPIESHQHVPEVQGAFSDQFSFGRDQAPINGELQKGKAASC